MRRPSLLVHIGLMILASVIIVVLALVWMNLFTRHGSSVEIPNIYGLPASEAVRLLDKADLRYEVIDSVYTTEVPKGAVYDLSPKAGSRVKAGRIIFLTLNASSPRNGIIPSLVDVSERQARARLVSLGFENITPSYVAGSFDDLVMGVQLPSGQTLAPGTRIPLATPLILLVSVATSDSIPYGAFEPYDSIMGTGGQALPADSTTHILEPDEDESWM